ncbi:carotenoid oxygenase family protein [Streptomyces sp. NPDC004327]
MARLDAADLAADPVAVAHLPARIPYGFHGSRLPDGP